jgi:dCTP deaminase
VYAGMKIGQIMFFVSTGAVDPYRGKYQAATGPQPSAYWRDLARLQVVAT